MLILCAVKKVVKIVVIELITTLIAIVSDFFDSVGNMLHFFTYGLNTSFEFITGGMNVIMAALEGMPSVIFATALGIIGLSAIKLLLPGGN